MDTIVTAGFMPLLDSAILVFAHEKGFATAEGLSLSLMRETSWANIRDRVGVGQFDVAHMLAPMPIAAALGLSPLAIPFIAPMALGLGGNAVTVSADLWRAMARAGADPDLAPGPSGKALKAAITRLGTRLRFGVVHQNSSHNYELRYWLAASGIVPDRDVEIVVLPPPLLPDALGAGAIDGYCVGEPWNSVGVAQQRARIATVKAAIWRSSPDKVLGMRTAWAEEHPETLAALLRALHGAALWCTDPVNHEEAASILSRPHYLGQTSALIKRGLSGRLAIGDGAEIKTEDFFVPNALAANFPWKSHALWFYSQMVRWGHVGHSATNAALAAASFRPDLYRAAIAPLGVPVPRTDSKVEGSLSKPKTIGGTPLGPDGFFDGQMFDPEQLDAYIAAQRTP